jgi:hypothetical protein
MSERTRRRADLLRPHRKDVYEQTYDYLTARPAIIILALLIVMWAAILIWSFELMTLASIGGG